MDFKEEADPRIGSVIDGKYRVDSLLGEGGMGKVYSVTHLNLSKRFALKLMHVNVGIEDQNFIRFRREAEALAKIAHPNVVMVTDFGMSAEQSPYIVMEFIEGFSLRQLFKRRGRISERQVIHITKQICAGLHEAHRQGIIHRDLKPENIMIQEFADGEIIARVLDFGIANFLKDSNGESIKEEDAVGTIKYMSPEQLYGEDIEAASDIFTICLIMYESLTGIVPTVLLSKTQPLYELRPELSYPLNDIVMRGLSRNPTHRPRNVLELKRELENLEQENMFQRAAVDLENRPAYQMPVPNVPAFHTESGRSVKTTVGKPIEQDPLIERAGNDQPASERNREREIDRGNERGNERTQRNSDLNTNDRITLERKPADRVTIDHRAANDNATTEHRAERRPLKERTTSEEGVFNLLEQAEEKQNEKLELDEPPSPAGSYERPDYDDYELGQSNEQFDQAASDFHLFLNGQRAPLIVGASLAAVINSGPATVVPILMRWALQLNDQELVESLMSARNKVFDIFFYQIVRFKKIYKFFPEFERQLIDACRGDDQQLLSGMFAKFKWQDIRPIGLVRESQQQFIAEKRKEIKIQPEKFNENIYKNATFSVLSADRRYQFNDSKIADQIAVYQVRVKSVLDDFVELVQDKQVKKEILLANESDKYNNYQNKEKFNQESYLAQLAEIGVALFNDNFLYHSVRIFKIIRELSGQWQVNLGELAKFQEKGELVNTQIIEVYLNSELDRLLVRQIIKIFTCWHPQYMLDQIQIEENRRVRRALLKMLECYGREIHNLVVNELTTNGHSQPWFYARNLSALLGRMTWNNDDQKEELLAILEKFWLKNAQRQLVQQIISTLSQINYPKATNLLIERFRQVENQKDQRATDLKQKLLSALIETEADEALEVVIDYYQKESQLEQLVERFNKMHISERVINFVAEKIWKENQRLKYSFSLFGDVETTVELLHLIWHMGTEQVHALCREIIEKVSRKHPLVAEAERALTFQPMVFYSNDRMLHKLANTKNLPRLISYITEAGLTCTLTVHAESVEGEIDFIQGETEHANVLAYKLTREDAFYWCFLLDPGQIESVYCNISTTIQPASEPFHCPTEMLIIDGLWQRGEIAQISKHFISPNAQYSQRPVNSFFTNFAQLTDEPMKYRAIWNELTEPCDVAKLQHKTHLSKYDIYKIMYFFFKQKMLIINGQQEEEKDVYFEDGILMLELNLKRIERRPVMFNFYKTTAEICADIMREIPDDILRYALDILRRYFLERYEHRSMLNETMLNNCREAVELMKNYAKSSGDQERNLLIYYVQSNFEITDAPSLAEAMADDPVLQTAALEKMENIEQHNDPLDSNEENNDQSILKETFQVLSEQIDEAAVSSSMSPDQDNEGAEIDAAENKRLLFDNLAQACVKPLKDFVRELYRNWRLGRQTSLAWIDLITPVLDLMTDAAEQAGYQQISELVVELQNAIAEQRALASAAKQLVFNDLISQQIAMNYLKLCEIQPKTFALVASEEDLAEKKEILITKFMLRQVNGINDRLINRLLFSGWNTFDRYTESKPEELARIADIPKSLAEEILMKFYQYRNIYYQEGVTNYQEKFVAMFEMSLRMLKETQADIEKLTLEELAGSQDGTLKGRKEGAIQERQRMLFGLFILLCVKEEYDLIQMIQQSVFDMRVKLLDEYLGRLAAAIPNYQMQA